MQPSNVVIRAATEDDIENIVRLGRSFYRLTLQAKAGHEYGPERVAAFCRELINNPDAVIFVAYMNERLVGMGAFMMSYTWFLKDQINVQELWWFVHKAFRKHGIGSDLLEVAEMWARVNGASSLMMVNLDNLDPAAREMYLRRGYEQQETVYLKEI